MDDVIRRRNVFLSVGLGTVMLGIIWLMSLTLLSDVGGEYFYPSPQLGTVRMSIHRNADKISGSLSFETGPRFELQPVNSYNPDDLNFVFAPQQVRNRKVEKNRKVVLTGKYLDGSITGTIEDRGGVYPVQFERNGTYSIFRTFFH
jgi:hypothetical protein